MPRRDLSLLALLGLTLLAACAQLGGSDFTPTEPPAEFDVTTRSPAPGSAGVPTTVMVSIGFNAPIDPASVQLGSVSLNGSPAGRLEASGSTLRFYPAGALVPGSSYEVQLGASLRSFEGEVLGATPTWGFKTAGAAPPPDTILAARPRPR